MSVVHPGDIISHAVMCVVEGVSLQKGMNFHIKGGQTVILTSLPNTKDLKVFPKTLDQLYQTIKGTLMENGNSSKLSNDYSKGGIHLTLTISNCYRAF